MAGRPGCFKSGCFGCLGLLALLILIVLINLAIAWSDLDDQPMRDRELKPSGVIGTETATDTGATGMTTATGRVLLDLSQGEFHIDPAPAGEGFSVKARYDEEMYALEEKFTPASADSGWTYEVKFYRTMPWMQALFRKLLGDGEDPSVRILLPRDVAMELGLLIQEGGAEVDLGGLWLTDARVMFNKGGMSLAVSEPTREPLKLLRVHGSMGGFEADRLGNLSPEKIDIRCRMGGAEIDLRGQWQNDSDVDVNVRMGGMVVIVPEDVRVQGVPSIGAPALSETPEVPVPTLNLHLTQKMGEIEVEQY